MVYNWYIYRSAETARRHGLLPRTLAGTDRAVSGLFLHRDPSAAARGGAGLPDDPGAARKTAGTAEHHLELALSASAACA